VGRSIRVATGVIAAISVIGALLGAVMRGVTRGLTRRVVTGDVLERMCLGDRRMGRIECLGA